MPFWVKLIIFAAICFVLRVLRSLFKWVEVVFFLIVLGLSVWNWIDNGFWTALGTFLVGLLAMRILLGVGHEDKVKNNGKTIILKPCPDCGYEYFEIVERNEDTMFCRCERCGKFWQFDI